MTSNTLSLRQTFSDAAQFETVWERGRGQGTPPAGIAERIGRALAPAGFRLFHNGGLPRLDRRRGALQEEIMFLPGPTDDGFAVRFHLNHEGLGEVRQKFWRPATRAPKAVASGDVGLLESPPVRSIWSAADPVGVADAIRERLVDDLLPWLDVFDDPQTLLETLMASSLPLVDDSTALELILAEFGVRDARRFLRTRLDLETPLAPADYSQGFDLGRDRIPAVARYYRL